MAANKFFDKHRADKGHVLVLGDLVKQVANMRIPSPTDFTFVNGGADTSVKLPGAAVWSDIYRKHSDIVSNCTESFSDTHTESMETVERVLASFRDAMRTGVFRAPALTIES